MHPDQPFPGVVGLRASREVPTLVFKSVFQTLAFAGYPRISVQTVGSVQPIFSLDAQVPAPPDPNASIEPRPPEKVLHLFTGEELSLVWKQGSVVVAETKLPSPDLLAGAICKEWTESGSHRDPGDLVPDQLVLHANDKMAFHEIVASLDAAQHCTRDFRGAGGALEKRPAFNVTFSIR